ncbi:hypothetical protein R7040_18380 [Vibrio sp. 1069]|nr:MULTISPECIES: hypothetical protein [Vibrio]MDW1500136.1 hypothetical protein [Vibrio sp. YT-19(2023)]MDW1763103.1 hypothetical protein [Vibrio sp. Vb2135]MDW2333061.1 hypothetical protein [Vibrio sp. 1069]
MVTTKFHGFKGKEELIKTLAKDLASIFSEAAIDLDVCLEYDSEEIASGSVRDAENVVAKFEFNKFLNPTNQITYTDISKTYA